jgi:hypothetical protein
MFGKSNPGLFNYKICFFSYHIDMSITKTSLVLVAVMNEPRDLEIARLLGWYRIPLRSAPKVIAVDYLAFYQTAAFGAEGMAIHYIASVRGHELTTRAELFKDEPNHPRASHEYYKLQLGPLERLAHPIPARKWRRITFFYTTGEYLLEAESVDDLAVKSSDERQTLWHSLRERAGLPESDGDEAALDPAVLAALLGLAKK